MATAEQAGVEAEHGDHDIGAVQGGGQRGVIVQAQVAAQPEQHGGGHGPRLTRCRDFHNAV